MSETEMLRPALPGYRAVVGKDILALNPRTFATERIFSIITGNSYRQYIGRMALAADGMTL